MTDKKICFITDAGRGMAVQDDCLHGGRYGFDDVDGGQGEAVRVPQADGTLVVLPAAPTTA